MPPLFCILNTLIPLGRCQANVQITYMCSMQVLYSHRKNVFMFYFRDYQEPWYFLFPTSNLFVILNTYSFILIESVGNEF